MGKADQHTTQVRYMKNHAWMISTNLHPYDGAHSDTCSFAVLLVKPTKRFIRKFHKESLKHKKPACIRNFIAGEIGETKGGFYG